MNRKKNSAKNSATAPIVEPKGRRVSGLKGVAGMLYDDGTLFLRFECGKATSTDTGITYELCTNVDGSPIVRSSKTGRYFTMSWHQLIGAAIAAKINERP
jgi:hypothetical protein